MPAFFHKPISRKFFLRQGITIVGAATLGAAPFRVMSAPQKEAYLALLSDTHVSADVHNNYRGFYPYRNLEQVVNQVRKTRPEGVIINGDVARLTGERDDYANVRQLLEPLAAESPIYMGMGNHDDRQHFFEIFPQRQDQSLVQEKYVSIIETEPVRILLLDSLLYVNKVAGLLGQQQRNWLQNYLSSADTKATVLFVHHTLGDRDSDLLDANRMFDIIRPYDQVKGVFYGHSHRYHVEESGGLYLINLPALGYNFNDDQPTGWLETRFTEEGVKLKLHTIGGNQAENGQTKEIRWKA